MENQQKDQYKTFVLTSKGTHIFRLVLVILVGLGAVVGVVLLALHSRVDEDRNQAGVPIDVPPITRGSMLSLVSDKQAYKVGEEFDVDLTLYSREIEVVGMDAQLNYDPSAVRPEPLNASAKDPATKYLSTAGSVFDTFLGFAIDSNKGLITLSALVSPGSGKYAANGTVAKLRFKALKAGQTSVSFKFEKNSTTDTNVARTAGNGGDALDRVKNLDLTIQ